MENSLNIPSSLPCFHVLQTHPWPAHLFLTLAGTWWRVEAVAKSVCGLKLLEVPVCLDVPAAPGCPISAATCHLPRAITQPPATKIPSGTELCVVFQFFFFFKVILLKLSDPLDGAQFHTQNYLKISSNLEWESTKEHARILSSRQLQHLCSKDGILFIFLFFDNTNRSGVSNWVWMCKYRKI